MFEPHSQDGQDGHYLSIRQNHACQWCLSTFSANLQFESGLITGTWWTQSDAGVLMLQTPEGQCLWRKPLSLLGCTNDCSKACPCPVWTAVLSSVMTWRRALAGAGVQWSRPVFPTIFVGNTFSTIFILPAHIWALMQARKASSEDPSVRSGPFVSHSSISLNRRSKCLSQLPPWGGAPEHATRVWVTSH